MSVEGSAFGMKTNIPFATAPLRLVKPTQQGRVASLRCSRSDLGGSGKDLFPESDQRDGQCPTEQVSVALPKQLSKSMVVLLASLSARDFSTCFSSHRAGLPLSSLILVSYSYASSDRFDLRLAHVIDRLSGSSSIRREIDPPFRTSSSLNLLARSVGQSCCV